MLGLVIQHINIGSKRCVFFISLSVAINYTIFLLKLLGITEFPEEGLCYALENKEFKVDEIKIEVRENLDAIHMESLSLANKLIDSIKRPEIRIRKIFDEFHDLVKRS